MKRLMLPAALLLALAFGLGCGGSSAPAEPSEARSKGEQTLPKSVRTAVAVAYGLEATPNDIEGVLQRQGLTVEQYEDLMYEISSDPALREAYSSAMSHHVP